MKKFAAGYPIEGTSALQLEPIVRDAPIIAFPGSPTAPRATANAARRSVDSGSAPRAFGELERRALRTELVANLREGDAAGQPFGRMRPLQAALGGFLLTATAFVGLLVAL